MFGNLEHTLNPVLMKENPIYRIELGSDNLDTDQADLCLFVSQVGEVRASRLERSNYLQTECVRCWRPPSGRRVPRQSDKTSGRRRRSISTALSLQCITMKTHSGLKK